MAMNRQGVFISLTALLIVGSFMIIFTPELTRTGGDAVETRLQNFAQDRASLEEQLIPATVRVHTRRAINSLVEQVVDQNISISDRGELEEFLEECLGADGQFTENLIDNHEVVKTECGEGSFERENFVQSIRDIERRYVDSLQYDVKIVIEELEIEQNTSWMLEITAEVTTFMNDSADFARYENTKRITTQLPIEGLIDPLASDKRNQPHVVRRTRVSNWTQDFNAHALRGGYIFDENGPGYLDRLLGNTDRDEWRYGIHSLVESTNQNVNTSSLDYDDYEYSEPCLVSIRIQGSTFFHLPSEYMLGYDQGRVLDETYQQYNQANCEDSDDDDDPTEE